MYMGDKGLGDVWPIDRNQAVLRDETHRHACKAGEIAHKYKSQRRQAFLDSSASIRSLEGVVDAGVETQKRRIKTKPEREASASSSPLPPAGL